MRLDTLINAVKTLETRALTRSLSAKEERQLTSFFSEAWDSILYSPSKDIYGTSKTIGKHKMPRYLYHLTTEEAYLSMLKDGKILPAQCADSSNGIFLFDIKNFTRFWRRNKNVAEQPRTTLLNNVAGRLLKPNGNIVMLKIPTHELDVRTLRLRLQKLCRMGHGNVQQEQESILNDKYKFSNALEGLRYLMQGESVANAPLYNQRKEAIEFITPNEIPIDKVSLLGKVNVDKERIDRAHWDMQDLPDIWKALTQGTPEAKSFECMM